MLLREIVQSLETFSREDAIYAQYIDGEWTSVSEAVVAEESEDGSLTQFIQGMEFRYVLPVFLALEVIEVWRTWSNQSNPSLEEKVRAIIYYAKYDAYLPLEENDAWL